MPATAINPAFAAAMERMAAQEAEARAIQAAKPREQVLREDIEGRLAIVRSLIGKARAHRAWLRKVSAHNPGAQVFYGDAGGFLKEARRVYDGTRFAKAELAAMAAAAPAQLLAAE